MQRDLSTIQDTSGATPTWKSAPDRASGLVARQVGTDDLVVAVRRGHPLLETALSARRYAETDHVVVSRRGRLRDPIDDALAELGLTRRVIASLPTSLAAFNTVATSDLAVTTARATCTDLAAAFGLATTPVPVPVRPLPITLAWHRRLDTDPAHRWFRDLVIDVTTTR